MRRSKKPIPQAPKTRHSSKKTKSALMSMTGFGRARGALGGVSLEVEIKAINHRFLDINVKLPRVYSEFEIDLRSRIAERLGRGRVEVSIVRMRSTTKIGLVKFDPAQYQALTKIYRSLLAKEGLSTSGSGSESRTLRAQILFEILKRNEILGTQEDAEILHPKEAALMFRLIEEALVSVSEMRRREGQRLALDLEPRLEVLEKLGRAIQAKGKYLAGMMKERILGRVARLSPEVNLDESRLSAEVALLTERVDVTEELVRLESHLKEFRKILLGSSQGKKLDFLLQELGREFNTIGSKAQDSEVQRCVVDAKLEIEKIREQIQNIV